MLKGTVRPLWLVLLSFIWIAGCARLITPDTEPVIRTLEAGNYRIDPEHSTLLFKVSHLGLSKVVGRFNRFDASLSFDPEHLALSSLDASVETASIDLNNERFEDQLRGDEWLNSERHPQAYFRTGSVRQVDEGTAVFSGELTLLGVTAPVDLEISFNGGAFNMLTGRYTIGFSAKGQFQRSSFGMDRYIPAAGDQIELEIHAEFQRL